MSTTSLQKVIKEVKTLTQEEQLQVRELIESLLENPAETPEVLSFEDRLERRLLERGVISEIPKRNFDPIPTKSSSRSKSKASLCLKP